MAQKKIEKLWAVIAAKGDGEGGEGICGMGPIPGMEIPIITAEVSFVPELSKVAAEIAHVSKATLLVVEFTRVRVLETVHGEANSEGNKGNSKGKEVSN